MDNNNVNALKWKIIFRSLPVLGFMLLAAGAGHMVYIGRPYIPDIVALALGILLFLTLFIRAEVANIKYYANVFTYSLFVFIFCAVGYMFARSRSSMQWDFTKSKFFSLSDQSTKVVKNLKKEVEVAVFYQDAKSHFREIDRPRSALRPGDRRPARALPRVAHHLGRHAAHAFPRGGPGAQRDHLRRRRRTGAARVGRRARPARHSGPLVPQRRRGAQKRPRPRA